MPPMHVSERPVVYPRPFKIFERAGRVVHMGSIATYIGVHQTDRERFGISFAETQRQVVVDVSCRIADAVNDRAFGIVLKYRHGFQPSYQSAYSLADSPAAPPNRRADRDCRGRRKSVCRHRPAVSGPRRT